MAFDYNSLAVGHNFDLCIHIDICIQIDLPSSIKIINILKNLSHLNFLLIKIITLTVKQVPPFKHEVLEQISMTESQ